MHFTHLIKKFNEKIPKFLIHAYRTSHQFKILGKLKNNLQKNGALLVVDFSQNYNCKYDKEIQSVHFGASKKKISL